LVGVAMVMINFHVELCIESYALDIGTGLEKGTFPQTSPWGHRHRLFVGATSNFAFATR
jgi:hypothetical protein